MTSKNYLMLCELYHPKLHGFDENSDPNIFGHHMVAYIKHSRESDNESDGGYSDDYNDDDDSSDENDELTLDNTIMQTYQNKYKNLVQNSLKFNINLEHKIVRNYINIVTKDNYITPHIGQRIYLSGDECVAIIKTTWLRIVQRCWRRVYKTRMQIINNIKRNPQYLLRREYDSKWSIRIPTIHGMFWNFNAWKTTTVMEH
jgi:hypothetical protein